MTSVDLNPGVPVKYFRTRALLVMSVVAIASLSIPLTSASAAGSAGTTWGVTPIPQAGTWTSVIYAKNQFVAVASDGAKRVMTSPNGKTWTLRNAAAQSEWVSIAYGNGKYVAVASGSGTNVMTSTDGVTWTGHEGPLSGLATVTYGNGLFVALAQSPSPTVLMTSTDGVTWTARNTYPGPWQSVAYGNGKFVAVASTDYGCCSSIVSVDGIAWFYNPALSGKSWSQVTFGNGRFVAVSGDPFESEQIKTSTDAITWTPVTISGENPTAVTYGNGLFVAAGGRGANRVVTSSNGTTWNLSGNAVLSQINIKSIAYGGGAFVGVGVGGTNAALSTGPSKDYLGVVRAKFGPGPRKVAGWALGGALLKDVQVTMAVLPASKSICAVNKGNDLYAIKNGDCKVRLTFRSKAGKVSTKDVLLEAIRTVTPTTTIPPVVNN